MADTSDFPSFIPRSEQLDLQTDLVAAGRVGRCGVVELRRPKALNSLNDPMIRALDRVVDAWGDAGAVDVILLMASTPRAFCAGGDVRWVRDEDARGNYRVGDDFFELEYAVNHRLATVEVPVVSLLEGVVMGGGFGISAHGSHRIVTPRTLGAMPEGAIGFVPDVGMSHKLTHLPVDPRIGLFVALTGWRLSPADMVFTGLGTHVVEDAAAFANAVVEQCGEQGQPLEEALRTHATPREKAGAAVGESALEKHAEDICELCTGETWAELEKKIRAAGEQRSEDDGDFWDTVISSLDSANPESLVATAELFRRSAETDLRTALDNEWRVGSELRRRKNFLEGVRAVLIDKDRNASFDPASASEANPEEWRALLR